MGWPATDAIVITESVRLERPVPEVFRFWRDFRNLPRFMPHLERVSELGGRRSRWVARGPAGVRLTWDAEIVHEIENELIAWRSLPGSDIALAGSVRFGTARAGRSAEVAVRLHYAPPVGRASALLATMLGANPSHTIREGLRRVKQLLEAGEISRTVPERPAARAR
jgi:uncharacterized membrane protein